VRPEGELTTGYERPTRRFTLTEPGKSLAIAKRVLQTEADAIRDVLARLDSSFEEAVALLLGCKGRVVVTGMGKSGLIGRKIAATLSSTGTPSFFLHPAEALHGDLGMLARGDVMLAISYGGETVEIIQLLATIERLAMPLVILTGKVRSTLGRSSDIVLNAGVSREACPLNLVPTASTTVALALGDALAVALLEQRGFRLEDFAVLHPGGQLGKRFVRVAGLMRAGNSLPRVSPETAMPAVFHEISRKGLGMTTVVDSRGGLAGIITDGDLRRMMEKFRGCALDMSARECMTCDPYTVNPEVLAGEVARLMKRLAITSVVVVGNTGIVLGVVHLHDLWELSCT
jgi:arabinose-5-phosphate isomerase